MNYFSKKKYIVWYLNFKISSYIVRRLMKNYTKIDTEIQRQKANPFYLFISSYLFLSN